MLGLFCYLFCIIINSSFCPGAGYYSLGNNSIKYLNFWVHWKFADNSEATLSYKLSLKDRPLKIKFKELKTSGNLLTTCFIWLPGIRI